MDAKELRIGNWVHTGSFHISKLQGHHQYLPEWHKYAFKFEPIPLTEEWLERFGFEYDENDDWFVFESNKEVSFSMDKNGVMYYFGNLEPLWVDILSKIKYVHQLQNLYFALTGEELNQNK